MPLNGILYLDVEMILVLSNIDYPEALLLAQEAKTFDFYSRRRIRMCGNFRGT